MSFFSFLLGEKKKTAGVAKERLQIILAHERTARSPRPEPLKRSAAHYLWAVLIARIYEVFPLLCPMCGVQFEPDWDLAAQPAANFDVDQRVKW